MSNEDVASLLSVVFGETRSRLWSALEESRRADLGPILDTDTSDSLTQSKESTTTPDIIRQLHDALDDEDAVRVAELVASATEHDLADTLEAMPDPGRRELWDAIPDDKRTEVLIWLDEGARASLLAGMTEAEVVPLVRDMEHDDLVEVVESVSDELADAILRSLPKDERANMEARLLYPEDCAGRLMEDEWVAVRADVSLEVVGRYLKRLGSLPSHTDGLMVVDREGHYLGKLPVSILLTRDESLQVASVMESNVDWVTVDMDQADVADLFERREVASIAVVDGTHKLIGRITLDDVIDVIREEAEAPLLHMAGLDDDEDLFAPVLISARRRMVWLGINLATAFLAAYVIGLFEATLQQVVALAVLMPIVASMGGIAGSQTLTLAIRGLALDQITTSNTRWLAIKEVTIAGINGLLWALVVSFIAWAWFGDVRISVVIAVAMLLNQFAAAAAGLGVPLVLDRLGIDPALSGSVVLTTVTDVVGFMSFLGLATLVLL
ncbi:MAG: magnesium transporter [Gammaproteobacteria bacterium]|nr:magnesium transporter [Gammaproteobacteria bacterium]MCP5136308.1 magnesium transporter [Gammaproteobacteria bacterium]